MTGQATSNPPSSPFTAAFVADPYPTYAALREAGPVHRMPLPDGTTAWLVTRYADVRAALADPRLSLDKANSDGTWRGFSLPPALDANLLNMDPPNHTRIRRLIRAAFGPQRITALLGAGKVPFSEVSAHRATLEEAYMELTRDAVEYRAEPAREATR